MRLLISRSQDEMRGMLGGSKGFTFTLSYRLELTSAEGEIVQRYKLQTYPVTFRDGIPSNTVGSLIQGGSQTVNDVETLLKNEEVIKSACDGLPILFDAIRSFGGTEVVNYPRTV